MFYNFEPSTRRARSRRGSALTFGKMSTQAKLFAAYFGIGLLLMVLAFISRRATRGLKTLDPLVDAGHIAAGMLIFIALLWPVWLVALMFQKDGDSRRDR